jgi:hypothetical protein
MRTLILGNDLEKSGTDGTSRDIFLLPAIRSTISGAHCATNEEEKLAIGLKPQVDVSCSSIGASSDYRFEPTALSVSVSKGISTTFSNILT